MMTTSVSVPFKIHPPNYEEGAGPDTTLIPLANLPIYVKQATFHFVNGEVSWFTLQRCPAQGNVQVWTLQANMTTDIISPTYLFELSVLGNTMMTLDSSVVTGNVTVDKDADAYNAHVFVTILEHRPGYVLLELNRKDMIPITSTPVNISLNLHFQ